jgi:hypothetical protein
MLKANVGVSRKMSRDYNSRGFTLNLEGEILATLDDPEAVVIRVKELFDLAEEALDRKIEEAEEMDAFSRRDAEDNEAPRPNSPTNGQHRNGHDGNGISDHSGRPQNGEPATNKQVQFLQILARRNRLIGPKLEGFIREVTGRGCSPYDLTKKEAAAVIDRLSNPQPTEATRR